MRLGLVSNADAMEVAAVKAIAELAGFATFKREGILMRAGSTFSVDVELKVGSLSETVTVSGESPMIETQKPTSVLNIQGELLRAAPVTEPACITAWKTSPS